MLWQSEFHLIIKTKNAKKQILKNIHAFDQKYRTLIITNSLLICYVSRFFIFRKQDFEILQTAVVIARKAHLRKQRKHVKMHFWMSLQHYVIARNIFLVYDRFKIISC